MTFEEELGQAIGESISQGDQSTEFAEPSVSTTSYQVNAYTLLVRLTFIRIRERTIGSAFIIGSPTHGVLGTDQLGVGSMGGWSNILSTVLSTPITDVGKNQIATWLNSNSESTPDSPVYLAIGTDDTAATTADTALGGEVDDRMLSSPIGVGTDKRVEYTFMVTDADITDGRSWEELGLFDAEASSTGNMYLRYVNATAITFDQDKQYEVTLRFDLEDITSGNAIMPTDGLNEIRNFMANDPGDPPSYTEWADGTTVLAASDTTLTGSGNQDRNAFVIQSRSNNRVTFESLLGVTELNSVDITKTGIFNASSGGNLFAESLFSALAKTSSFDIRNFSIITVL